MTNRTNLESVSLDSLLQELALAARYTWNDREWAARIELLGRFAALESDAQRMRGLRLLLCETSESLQSVMAVAMDEYMDANKLDDIKQLTPELFDSIIDGLLAAAATARAKVTE